MPDQVEGAEVTAGELDAQAGTADTDTREDEAISVLQVNTDTAINAPLDEVDDPDTLRKIVKKLRHENARTRTEKNASKDELAEFRAWKESQMTEAEKLQARVEAAEARALAAERKAIIKEFGLDDDLAEFVSGSETEMRAKAERLAAKVKSAAPSIPAQFTAPGGAPVAKDTATGGSFLSFLAKRDLGA